MKTITKLLLCASLFWACHNAAPETKEVVQPAEPAHHQGQVTPALTLNNGAKWHSDKSTSKNVAALEGIADRFQAKGGKDLAAYTAVGSELQTALNTLVSECRMQGEDHEALHHWLEPLLTKVKALQKATTEEEAATLFGAVNDQLNLYHQYFEET